jgi:hypothetical protein
MEPQEGANWSSDRALPHDFNIFLVTNQGIPWAGTLNVCAGLVECIDVQAGCWDQEGEEANCAHFVMSGWYC